MTIEAPLLADVYRARQLIRRFLPPTPLLASRQLSEQTGCDVYVKYENMTPIRSFKGRGALACLANLPTEIPGVCCASTGNHGQGIAFAAKCFSKRAVVVVSDGANPQKMRAIESLGAELRIAGADLASANEAARRIAEAEGLRYVEDGEDPEVMIGCATLGLELVEQLSDINVVFVPVGGGNLAAACCFALNALAPSIDVVGVQSAAAPAVYESWRQGQPVTIDTCETFAGGLATSYPGPFTFPYLQRGLADFLLISDDDIRAAAVTMLAATGHLPEGAGATALAGLLAAADRYHGQRVVVLLTGGNFEPTLWSAVTASLAAGSAEGDSESL